MKNRYPFKFLDAYSTEDTDIFFGRNEEIQSLYQMVFQSDMLLVYGASGTGKTSLIQCGLASKFESHDWLPIFVRRVNNLNQSLIEQLRATGAETTTKKVSWYQSREKSKEEQDKSDKQTSIIVALKSIYLQFFKPIYLVFDQFEELYILGNKEEQSQFIETIKEILASGQAVKIIFSIREEYLGHLYNFEKKVPQLLRKKIRVEPMNIDKVGQIIKGATSLKESIISIEQGEDKKLIEAVFEKLKGKNELTIELPYLQVLLDKLYKSLTNDEEHKKEAIFNLDAFEKLGNIGDILSDFLEGQVNVIRNLLKKNFKRATINNLWKILSPFATLEGTKEPLTKEALYQQLPKIPKRLIDTVLETFISKGRILRYIKSSSVYELTHDALAKCIAEKRSDDEIAVMEVRRLIKSQVALRDQTRELFTPKQLTFIENFIEQLQLTKEEQKLIDQSYQAAEEELKKERRKQRNKLLLVGSVAIVAIIAAVVTVIMSFYARRAEKTALNANILAVKSLQHAEVNLYKFEKEQAKKDSLNFIVLEDRVISIIDANLCPNDIIKEMKKIAKINPDSVIMNKKIISLESQLEPDCNLD